MYHIRRNFHQEKNFYPVFKIARPWAHWWKNFPQAFSAGLDEICTGENNARIHIIHHNNFIHTHVHTCLIMQTWINTFKLIREFNLAPIIIAALSIAALIVFKICNKLLQKPKVKVPFPVYERKARTCTTKKIKWPIPIPSQLIVVSKDKTWLVHVL